MYINYFNKKDGSPNFANYFDNQEFFKFLREKRPIVERALEQNENNIFFDYTESKDDQKYIKLYMDIFN